MAIALLAAKPAPSFWSRIAALFVRAAPAHPRLAGPVSRRSFDGASTARLYANWATPSTGPNTEIQQGLIVLRNRARDSVRNNPIAARAIDALTANAIGAGIRPRLVTDDEALRATVHTLWDRWSQACSVSDDLTIYGVQAMATRAMFESGEVFLRRRWRRPDDGLPVPVQVQLLESDFCPIYQMALLPQAGGEIVQGVEFDAIDRRDAYWLYRRHPGEWFGLLANGLTPVRVPAADVSHLFEPQRPGQIRGIPKLAPILAALRDLADYDLSERQRKKAESCIVGVVTPGDNAVESDDTDGLGTGVYDSDGNVLDTLEPGMFVVAKNGKSVTFTQPAQNAAYAEYVRAQVRLIASGLSIPYELFGDLSQVNYSSYRAGWVEFRRYISTLQQNVIIPLLCQPLWRWFIEAAVASGELPAGDYRVKWIPPRFEDVDRQKEVQAARDSVRSGFTSYRDEVFALGGDPDETLGELAADLAKARELGVSLDSDPNKAMGQGAPVVAAP